MIDSNDWLNLDENDLHNSVYEILKLKALYIQYALTSWFEKNTMMTIIQMNGNIPRGLWVLQNQIMIMAT